MAKEFFFHAFLCWFIGYLTQRQIETGLKVCVFLIRYLSEIQKLKNFVEVNLKKAKETDDGSVQKATKLTTIHLN